MISELNQITSFSRELMLLNLGIKDTAYSSYSKKLVTEAEIAEEVASLKQILSERIVA